MDALNYLAYGSNLCRSRLFARVGICEVVGVATIPGRRMAFRKKSHDGSAKCDLFVAAPDESAEGVIYRMPADMAPVLDEFEGVGVGYRVVQIDAFIDGQSIKSVAYEAIAPWITDDLLPFHWYRDYVLQGARDSGLSDRWIDAVAAHPVTQDADLSRATLNARILAMSDAEAQAMSEAGESS